ncbi:MAG: HD domain-containing protein [Methyloversatilis sp.]|uniref:phosphoribosyltransferase-like protein n=3 Tax=Methyloversatilis sp. TaxID=2569862 RepID=UPI0027359296|nr:HD domain-containing protein [Methyloversatilis sp.]MDP2870117.1 HD domain-containing protein [Methyloversatilis sp.]MDP3576832.1 HD domain-containing protein [Methyloversatilis sp.]
MNVSLSNAEHRKIRSAMLESQPYSLNSLKELANSFANDYLSEYVGCLKQPLHVFSRKEINDALWGTIGLTAPEVALLDSPLIQRLRNIRQLGVIHWVYPGAVHTRFEHTLGVLFQVQHLCTAINSVAMHGSDAPVISPHMIQLLRLAALLHDVGHAAFSHVSELAMESLPALNLLSAEFSQSNRIEKRQLSEIFAYFIVRSPAMRSFFEVVAEKCAPFISLEADAPRNIDLIVEKISNAIVGQHIDDKLPLLHELISGPFDADKLDYFVRDARLAGTPSVLDISRLVQKLSVKALDAKELPAEISRTVRLIDSKYYLFGVKWSGVAVLDELHLARVLLFAKIYRHPKVIAIEQMLRAAIITLSPLVSIETLLNFLYRNNDDAILGMDKQQLVSTLGIECAEASARIDCVAALLKSVRDRRLWSRAFQVQRRYPSDPLERDETQKEGLIEFLETLEHPQKRVLFMNTLLDDVYVLLKDLGFKEFSRDILDSMVMVHTLGPTPGGTQIARAYLISSTGKPLPFREYTVNRTAWADGYLSDQPKGYFLCPKEIADVVFLAIEKLVRIKYSVRLPSTALEVSKRDNSRVHELKKKLGVLRYYRNAPFDIRPVPERLSMADVPGKLNEIELLLATYQAPVTSNSGGARADKALAWLRQFDDDGHIDCALHLLGKIRVIGRAEAVEALRTFIQQNPEFKGASVVPLGGLKDSGAVQTYYAGDLLKEYVEKCCTLNEAAESTTYHPIIFVDDFVGSGGQAEDILAAGFGDIDLRKPLGEERSIFNVQVQEHLKNSPIAFVFTAAWDDGVQAVQNICKKLQINARVFRFIKEVDIPFAHGILKDMDSHLVDSFLIRCGEIGSALLDSAITTEPSTGADEIWEQKRNERKLGYGNRGMLLATTLNVPTQTLTLIWGEGLVDGVPWEPLLRRRKKK